MSTFVRPRNETHLDALGVTMVKLPSPPHLVETSPDGSLLVAATPHGATFYWPPNVNNADGSAAAPANAVHSVALNERISALAFLPQGARQGAAEGALRLYVATPQSVCVWDISTIPLSQTQQSRRDDRDLGPRTVIFRIADGEEEGGADPVGFQQRAARAATIRRRYAETRVQPQLGQNAARRQNSCSSATRETTPTNLGCPGQPIAMARSLAGRLAHCL